MGFQKYVLCVLAGWMCFGAEPAVLQLNLRRAVEIALSPEGNADLLLAGEGVKVAQAKAVQARASLLPSLEGQASVQSVTRNLSAMGLDGEFDGLRIPRGVGPFRVMDARVAVTQSVLDLPSVRRYQSSKLGIKAARNTMAGTQDLTASRIARSYVAVLRAEANLEVASENVKLAEAITRQAESMQKAGSGTGIEVTRARVTLADGKQKQLVAENQLSRTRQELLRAMNVRLETVLELTDRLSYSAVPAEDLAAWQARAVKNRSDLRSQEDKEAQAKLAFGAQRMERLPAVSTFADYGSLGTGFSNSLPTRSYGVSVRVPLFDGGKREGKTAEAASLYRQERIRTNDFRDQIELHLRQALDTLRSAQREVEVAAEGLSLAEQELRQARRRYEVGVANSLEVSDAQTRLAQARDNRVAALYRHNLAKIDLAEAAGTIQAFVQEGRVN